LEFVEQYQGMTLVWIWMSCFYFNNTHILATLHLFVLGCRGPVVDGSKNCPFESGLKTKKQLHGDNKISLVQFSLSYEYDHIKSKMGNRKKRDINHLKRKADRDEERTFCEPRCIFCHRSKTKSCEDWRKSVPNEN
jgi:hypothetical protein